MQVYPVGCMEGSTPVYVHVAANSKQEAETFVTQQRPEVNVISTFDSTETVNSDKVKTVKVTKTL